MKKKNEGVNVLNSAARRNHKELVEYLMEKGINIPEKNRLSENALHVAELWNRKELVVYLIEKGINKHT